MEDFSNRLRKTLDTQSPASAPSQAQGPISQRSGPISDQVREYEEHQRLLDIEVPSMMSEIARQLNARSATSGKWTNVSRIYTDYDKLVWGDTGDGVVQGYDEVTINGYYIAHGYGKRRPLSRKYTNYYVVYVGYTNGALQCSNGGVSTEELREAVLEVASEMQLYPKELSKIPGTLLELAPRLG